MGKYLLFLTYAKDLSALPENQEVSLRLITLANKDVKTLGTFVGGQGSLESTPGRPMATSGVHQLSDDRIAG